jgi:hypothetical protein
MQNVESLIAAEEIRQLKARYFRLLDTKQWDEFEALFAADATFDMRDAAGARDEKALLAGAPAIAAFVRDAVAGMVTVHHGHMPEIDVLSAHAARGTWAMADVLRWTTGGADDTQVLHGYGHYHDTYARVDGRWLIQSSRLSRLSVTVSRA